MLRAAVEAARSVSPALMVLGVTVLTSMDDQDLDKVGVRGRVVDQVLRLGALASTAAVRAWSLPHWKLPNWLPNWVTTF